MGALLVLLYGGATVLRAKYDVFPEFVPAQAEIQVEAPGLAPEDVERLVTQPLENAINGGGGRCGGGARTGPRRSPPPARGRGRCGALSRRGDGRVAGRRAAAA